MKDRSRPRRRTNEAYDRLLFALLHVESICCRTDREVAVMFRSQHSDVAYWVCAHICYSGVEQAMKMFLPPIDSHNLERLYKDLNNTAKCEDKKKREASKAAKIAIEHMRSYYRVYHSFHRLSDRPKEKTVEDFLQTIGDKYENWRYTLREVHDHPSMIHARFMIEIWRSLLRSGDSPWCRIPSTARIDGRICHYFQSMFRDAEEKAHLLTMSGDGTADLECINRWVEDMGGSLMAGLHVFRHLQRDEEHQIRVEGDTNECVIKSAKDYRHKIRKKVLPEGIFDKMLDLPERLHEIYLMSFMCKDGLRWNAESDVFEIEEEYAYPHAD